MDKDIIKLFKEKNKQILINNLEYDIEKNITSLLETITNIFNLEFDNAIKNIISIYEDAELMNNNKFIIDTINKVKLSSYSELEVLLNNKKELLEKAISSIEFDEEHIQNYYDIVFDTTKDLKEKLNKYSIVNVQDDAYNLFEKQIVEIVSNDNKDLLLTRINDYLKNRLFGKLEIKIHMEIMLRDNNLINKAKEGYLRYQEICAKTEEK